MAHGEVYAAEFGWDRSFEALVGEIVAGFARSQHPDRERGWIAELGGRRVGCVLCVDGEGGVAQLRLLLVTPEGRGHGLGGRLADACVAFARDAGYLRMRLYTNHPLLAARRIYGERGFVQVAERAHRSFGVALVGQTLELDLAASATAG